MAEHVFVNLFVLATLHLSSNIATVRGYLLVYSQNGCRRNGVVCVWNAEANIIQGLTAFLECVFVSEGCSKCSKCGVHVLPTNFTLNEKLIAEGIREKGNKGVAQ